MLATASPLNKARCLESALSDIDLAASEVHLRPNSGRRQASHGPASIDPQKATGPSFGSGGRDYKEGGSR
jgi:hypothetical protein